MSSFTPIRIHSYNKNSKLALHFAYFFVFFAYYIFFSFNTILGKVLSAFLVLHV